MTRIELALHCGVTERTIQRWEEETTGIPDDQKLVLTELFKVTVERLLGWDREGVTA